MIRAFVVREPSSKPELSEARSAYESLIWHQSKVRVGLCFLLLMASMVTLVLSRRVSEISELLLPRDAL